MKAFDYLIEFEQGATYRKSFTWKAGKPAAPVNLTGCTAYARFRVTNPPSTRRDLVLELTTENGGIVLGGASGTVELIVSETATRNFTWDRAAFQVYIKHANAEVTRLINGEAEVNHLV